MPNVTRNKIQEGIKSGHVSVNKNKVKPSYKVKPRFNKSRNIKTHKADRNKT